jgi:hypothetical protein
MRTSTVVPGILLCALLAAACGGKEPPARVEELEIRPRFAVGDRYRVREVRTIRSGDGRFPPAADLAARTQELRQEVHVYEEEVVEASAHRLFRVRRTYVSSVRGELPTPLAGKTYEITNPYTAAIVIRVEEPGGSLGPASPDEVAEITSGVARLAATLLPDREVREDETWPGRELPSLEIEPAALRVRLESYEPGRTARLTWQPSGRLATPGESSISMKETLTLDLERGRLGGFRSVTEVQRETPVTHWKHILFELSTVSIE